MKKVIRCASGFTRHEKWMYACGIVWRRVRAKQARSEM